MGPQNPILMIKAPILVCGLGLKGLWGLRGFGTSFQAFVGGASAVKFFGSMVQSLGFIAKGSTRAGDA